MFSEFGLALTHCESAILYAQQTGKIVQRKLYKIEGKSTTDERNEAFKEFGLGEPTEGNGAILLTMHSIGGVGLNLTGCHFAIFLEPLHNPQAERQAVNRM